MSDSVSTFEEWMSLVGSRIPLASNSPRNINQLYEDILKGEVLLKEKDGTFVRYGKAVFLNVFYDGYNGSFKIKETRYTLRQGRFLEEFLRGDLSAVKPSASRPSQYSISERMSLFGDGELPLDACVRALMEELFKYALENSSESYPNIEELLRTHIILDNRPKRVERGPYDEGNSYQGLVSVYTSYEAKITFLPFMEVPIARGPDGVPQRLCEYIEDKRYVNLYEWERYS